MKSIVIELQQDALNRDVPITDLLRKAFVVARKLKITEFEEWISKELEGYSDNADIPEYREVTGEVKAWNPYHGWQPIYWEEAKIAAAVSKRNCGQRIAEIESLLETRTEKGGSFQMPFSPENQELVCKAIGHQTQVTLVTPHTGLVRVVDAVRNIVLNWAIKLEEDGILGEEMTFSEIEKSEVGKHSYNVNNFYGEVTGAQIQQGTSESEQNLDMQNISIETVGSFITNLKNKLNGIALAEQAEKELEAEIATVEIQMASPKPKAKIIKESLGSIRRILEGASGGALAQLLIQLGSLF